jgi:hypothetical protein
VGYFQKQTEEIDFISAPSYEVCAVLGPETVPDGTLLALEVAKDKSLNRLRLRFRLEHVR